MIICLILATLIFIAWIIITVLSIKEDCSDGILISLCYGIVALIIQGILLFPFVALDKSSGSTVGKITSVDKNFWGTTAIYIKVNETKEEEYCAEDEEIIEIAKEYLGKNVKISYGTRVGLYHLNQCRQAPVEKIELEESK
jgi:hypothetical protein